MKKLKYFLGGLLCSSLVLAGFIFYVLSLGKTVTETTYSNERLSVEKYEINDSLIQINLNQYELMTKDFSKETLVVFWDSSCEDCIEEITMLKNYTENRNIDFIFINIDERNTEIFNKIEKIGVLKRFQLNTSEELSDASSLDINNILFQNKNKDHGRFTFPLKVIYKNGTYHSVFEIDTIEDLYFKELDQHFN